MLKNIIITVGIFLISLSTLGHSNMEVPTPTKVENKYQQILPTNSKAFQAAVKKEIHRLGIQHPEVVYFQFREESGNGGSNLAKRSFNLFGMKYPAKRKTTAIGKDKSGYAIYRSWKDSVKDYKMYQDRFMKNLSKSQYLKRLRGSYSGKRNYLRNYF